MAITTTRGEGIIPTHIMAKTLEDQQRLWARAFESAAQTYTDKGKDFSRSGVLENVYASADRELSARTIGTNVKETKLIYAGKGSAFLAAASASGMVEDGRVVYTGKGTAAYHGVVIAAADGKVFQRVDANTVVVHPATEKLNGEKVGKVMDITYSPNADASIRRTIAEVGHDASKKQTASRGIGR